MKKQLDQVKEFHVKAGAYTGTKITKDIPQEVKETRIALLEEEALEAAHAMRHESIEQVAKELSDVLYVTLGAMNAFGLGEKAEEIFTAVHESNLQKIDPKGETVMNEKGKVLKGENYREPDIASILSTP